MKKRQIDTRILLDDIRLFSYLREKGSQFLGNIEEIFNVTREILDARNPYFFQNYTLHDTGHSTRIMEYMYDCIEDINLLSELDITLLIYSALLHDVGMGVFSEEEIEQIKSESHSYLTKNNLKYEAFLKNYENKENMAIQEIIRRFHAERSADYILNELSTKLIIPNNSSWNFSEILAKICQSHTKDFQWIKGNLSSSETLGEFSFNPQYCACLLRLGDILDIDNKRTPPKLYELIKPKGRSDLEWQQHFIIQNSKKIVKCEITQRKKIILIGKSNIPSIHRKFLNYHKWIDNELREILSLKDDWNTNYPFDFVFPSELKIETKGYSIPEFKMNIDYNAITNLLMGENIYGNKKYGLRELIQNSIDACKMREEIEIRNKKFGDEDFIPKIKIILDKESKFVRIKDNGMGMSEDILKKHFLNVGSSYYSTPEYRFKGLNYKPIGNFGIGFLACFMLSERIRIKTRYRDSNEILSLELEKGSEFIVQRNVTENNFEGTEIILDYSDFLNAMNVDLKGIGDFLKTNTLFENLTIELVSKEDKITLDSSLTIDKYETDPSIKKIDISKYLKDIEGIAYIKSFVYKETSLFNLGLRQRIYYYSEKYDKLIEVIRKHESILPKLNELIIKNELEYLELTVVNADGEYHFEQLFDMYMDGEEVFEKLHDDEKTSIKILLNPNLISRIATEGHFSEDEKIVDSFKVFNISDIGFNPSCGLLLSKEKKKIFVGKNNSRYLSYNVSSNSLGIFDTILTSKKLNKCFVRNIFIKDFEIYNFLKFETFDIMAIAINIKHQKIIPNIARNNLKETDLQLVTYAINKALHLGVLEELIKPIMDNSIEEEFIKSFFEDSTILEK